MRPSYTNLASFEGVGIHWAKTPKNTHSLSLFKGLLSKGCQVGQRMPSVEDHLPKDANPTPVFEPKTHRMQRMPTLW